MISIGIAISVFTLIEIRKQTQVNAEQIDVLKRNSDIANKLIIFRDFYPKYAIRDAQKFAENTTVGVKMNMINYAESPLAYDSYFAFKFHNCGTGKLIPLDGIDRKGTEDALRDNNHYSIAPNSSENVIFQIDVAEIESARNEIEITNANFVLVIYTFLRLENIEHFDDFVKEAGFDLSDDFQINTEIANLPPNTKSINFKIPIRWNGAGIELSDYTGCISTTTKLNPQK
ncbi:hypothetical protein [uncultured Alteromonas sp.]|uniref:hypothetical protein n=1 Tax=uncultured Alteromonas sp. TaxID=179113 RepID=UPI0030EBFC9B